MLFCNPWRQQQQREDIDRALVIPDQDYYHSHLQNSQRQLPQEHGEPSVPNSSDSRRTIDSSFVTPIKKPKTTSTNEENPITMFFFGHKDDKKHEEEAEARTPETVATHMEEAEQEADGGEDSSETITPLSSTYPSTSDQQTPMIRMKNFFATPFVPREEQPSATKTGESEMSSLAIDTSQILESADSSESADNWLPLEKEASFLSRALNFDALLSTKNGEVETVEKEGDQNTTSSPFKFIAILTVIILVALSANNTRQLVQERRQVFRSAQAASVPPSKPFVEESVKPQVKPETSAIPSFQDMVDSSNAKAEPASHKPEPATEKTSFDLSSLLFWRTPIEHKEAFFPWVDESVVRVRVWTIETLKETHQRLLSLADFLQAHKEDREVRRLVWRDELQELKAAKGW